MKRVCLYGIALWVALTASISMAQLTAPLPASGGNTQVPDDSLIIFEPAQPLIDHSLRDLNSRPNTWGFSGSITDYGFGVGTFYRHAMSPVASFIARLDMGGAKGDKEFGFSNEVKINRIFVMPLTLGGEYRLFSSTLTEGFRPYVTAGAGPVFVMSNNGQQEYFSALLAPKFDITYGGYFGFGSYFGTDPTTSFSASIRYFIMPYPKGIQSTQNSTLTNFSGVSLTLSYGFSW